VLRRASVLGLAVIALAAGSACVAPVSERDSPTANVTRETAPADPTTPPLAAAGAASPTEEPRAPAPALLPECEPAEVVRVIDGDTISVRIGATTETVRLIGVDAPETVHPERPPEPFGEEARDYLSALLAGGTVCLERDVTERDRYGRLLRYVWLPDGTLVNEALLLAGLAVVTTYPPDVKYVESRFLPAQEAARNEGRGVWGEPPPTRAPAPAGPSEPRTSAAFEPPACYVPGRNSCNCSDFSSRAHAQWFHETLDPADVNRLDGDGDGLACESLP